MNHQAKIYLLIDGNFKSNDLIEELNFITPTLIFEKGEKAKSGKMWEFSSVRVGFFDGESEDLCGEYERVYNLLNPYRSVLKSAIKKYELKIYFEVVLKLSADSEISAPSIGLDQKMIAFFYDLEIYFDVDIYVYD